MLVHVLDCATLDPGRDPLSDLDVLEAELRAYGGGGLTDRPRLVALNKIDVPEARELADLVRPDLEARGLEVHEISAVSHEGLRGLTLRLAELVERYRLDHVPPEPTRIVLRPRPVGGNEFTVIPVGRPAVPGQRPQAAALGAPDRLHRTRRPSASSATGWPSSAWRRSSRSRAPKRAPRSSIGDVTFDWEPTLAEARHVGPRGTDSRVVTQVRKSREQRSCRNSSSVTSPLRGARGGRPRDRLVTRSLVAQAKRVVVKVGSSSLTTAKGGLDAKRVDALVDVLATETRQIILVSSGAISAGIAPLGLSRRPRDLATLQACASVGQLQLAERYAASFGRHREAGRPGAADQRRRRSAGRTTAMPAARWSGCSRSASCPSSTRTTPSPPTRSVSAATTGWPHSSPTRRRLTC